MFPDLKKSIFPWSYSQIVFLFLNLTELEALLSPRTTTYIVMIPSPHVPVS